MPYSFGKKHRCFYLILSVCIFYNGNAAVSQFLNDDFFQNPAELTNVSQSQYTLGSIFINPHVRYDGDANGVSGTVSSSTYNALPYLLTGYRINDQWVIGMNVLPSAYANLQWPTPSFISQISTKTKLLYYRAGIQSSYKLTEKWSLGAGFNLEDNAQYFINFVTPGQGNQINSIRGVNYTGDLGLYYRINDRHFLSLAGYTQVNTYGHGTSTSFTAINPNLSLNITEAPVIYLGLQHVINTNWFLEEKVYWSGWSIQRNLNFTNTTSASYLVPTHWNDTWSFQLNTRRVLNKTYALLGSIIYETNAAPLETNSVGYPLAKSGSLSTGLDMNLTKECSIQGTYTYSSFLPDSPINNSDSQGIVHAHAHAGAIQITYKN